MGHHIHNSQYNQSSKLVTMELLKYYLHTVVSDSIALEESETVSGLEGGNLTERELGKELGRLQVLGRIEVEGHSLNTRKKKTKKKTKKKKKKSAYLVSDSHLNVLDLDLNTVVLGGDESLGNARVVGVCNSHQN
jgi:hypothetical protein